MTTSQPFREFFLKEEINFNSLSDDTIIIFDTNTLLNIYRYSDFTKEKLISAIKKIKDNIWIPYQVGLEFNMNRRVVLREMRDEKDLRINNIKDSFEGHLKSIKNEINHFNLKSSDVQEHKKDAIDYVEKGFKELEEGLSKKLDELNSLMTLDEDLADTIADLFDGKIGESYSQEELNEKLSNAEKRYKDEIPPGYKDKKSKSGEFEKTFYNGVEFEKRFGDLILWYQIIDKASEDNIKKVVFVTNDNKADWWYAYKGETIGPRVELKNELLRKAKADLFMLNANSFLNNFSDANDLIIIDSQEESNLQIESQSLSKVEGKVLKDFERLFKKVVYSNIIAPKTKKSYIDLLEKGLLHNSEEVSWSDFSDESKEYFRNKLKEERIKNELSNNDKRELLTNKFLFSNEELSWSDLSDSEKLDYQDLKDKFKL